MDGILLKAKQFSNRQDELKIGTLEEGLLPTLGTYVYASNVDIDNNFKVSMRDGTNQVVAAATHSLYIHPEEDSTAYYMVGDTLYKLNDDYSATAVATLSTDNELCYDLCGTAIVATNGRDIGHVVGTSFTAFAQTAGQFEELMPAGQFLVYDNFDKCLLVVENNVIHRSKPYNPQIIDRRFSDFPLTGDIGFVGVVEDGWYIGTTHGIGFAARTEDGFTYRDISSVPPIRGCFYNGYEYMEKNRRRICAWASKDGISVGYANGEIKNLSYPTTAIDDGTSGKLVYRENNGFFQFIAIIRNNTDGYKHTKPTMTVNSVNI